jgi:hypothetical protein
MNGRETSEFPLICLLKLLAHGVVSLKTPNRSFALKLTDTRRRRPASLSCSTPALSPPPKEGGFGEIPSRGLRRRRHPAAAIGSLHGFMALRQEQQQSSKLRIPR